MNEVVIDQNMLKDLQYFCMFIGYPYSGHSLVGSIIDAHPNAVISHELHVGRWVKKGYPKERIFSMIILNSLSFAQHGRTWNNYSYAIPGEWNGRYDTIRVIGDKKGGGSTKFFTKKTEVFDVVESSFGIPVKFIHVMRNPYDIISTLYKKRKVANSDNLGQMIDKCLQHIEKVETIRQKIQPAQWLDIYHEQCISYPEDTIVALFSFFDLEVPAGFVDNCKKILYKNPHKSRLDVQWKDEEIAFVAEKLIQFERFSVYSFDS